MCLAIPGKLIAITQQLDETFRYGKVSFGGIMRDVNLSMVPEAKPNDYVLVHVGVAISIVDEVRHESNEQITGCGMGREELLKIPYDSTFWNTSTILKTTPLEDDIISDLGGGLSLNKQFYLYQEYERNVTDGGKNGEKKFNWLKEDSKGKRMLYVCFWNSNFQSYLIDLEAIKRLYPIYKNKITFVLVSLEEDETRWRQLVNRFNYFSDGIINYRIGKSSELIKSLNVKNTPTFILISKNGDLLDSPKRPSDPLLEEDFKLLMDQSEEH